MTFYNVGTVSVSGTAVTGSNTVWTDQILREQDLIIAYSNGQPVMLPVLSRTSETEAVLPFAHTSPAVTDAPYVIVQTNALPRLVENNETGRQLIDALESSTGVIAAAAPQTPTITGSDGDGQVAISATYPSGDPYPPTSAVLSYTTSAGEGVIEIPANIEANYTISGLQDSEVLDVKLIVYNGFGSAESNSVAVRAFGVPGAPDLTVTPIEGGFSITPIEGPTNGLATIEFEITLTEVV